MTKNEQVLTWGGIVLLLAFLAFGFKRGSVTYIESGDVMGPQLGNFPDVTVFNTDYQLGDIRIDRAMEYPPTGNCGCARGSGLTLDIAPIERYVFTPSPPRDPFVPVIPQGPPPLPKIEVFEHHDYNGVRGVFRSAVSNLKTTFPFLNDKISSVRVTGRWEVFEHAYFQGRSIIIDRDISELRNVAFYDRISSMRPI